MSMWPFNKKKKDPDILIRELDSDNENERTQAFLQLIDHEDQKVDALVLGALESFNKSSSKLLLPLVEIAGKRQIVEALPIFKAILLGKDHELKERTLQAVIAIPTQQSIDVLVSCLCDEDEKIGQHAREAIIDGYGIESMGALIRATPIDNSEPLYFEIVSLMETLDLFSIIKESFGHADANVKDFHFQTMVKFHRPEFIELYLDFYEVCSQDKRSEVEKALIEYSLSELISAFKVIFSKNVSESRFYLADKLIFSKYSEDRLQILAFIIGISEAKYRVRILTKLIDKFDPFVFETALDLVYDSVSEIRSRVVSVLSNIIKVTYKRISNKTEKNREALQKLYVNWEKRIIQMLKDSDGKAERQKEIRRLFYALVNNKHELIRPFLGYFVQAHFSETYHTIKTWDFDDQFDLLSWLIKDDASYASILLSALQDNPDNNLWRLIFKLLYILEEEEDREAFRRRVITRHRSLSLDPFMKDFDPMIRVTAISFAAEIKINGLSDILKKAMKDPSSMVRSMALDCLVKNKHSDILEILIEAANDPEEQISFRALQELKDKIPNYKLAPLLVKFINSKSEEIRTFALKEIANITKDKYKANFSKINPDTRKVVAKILQKIDHSFSDQLINELNSLDPQIRLQAALLLENISVGTKGKSALLAAMKDPSKKVRAAIVKTLGVIGDSNLIKQLIEFFNDPDTRVRANAIEAIASLGDRNAVQLLLPYLEDSNNRIRANAIVGISKIGKFNLMPIFQKMLHNHNENMQASALWAMGEIGDKNFSNFVYQFLNSPNELLRFNAIRTLSKIDIQVLKPLIVTLSQDPSAKIRSLVATISYKVSL